MCHIETKRLTENNKRKAQNNPFVTTNVSSLEPYSHQTIHIFTEPQMIFVVKAHHPEIDI